MPRLGSDRVEMGKRGEEAQPLDAMKLNQFLGMRIETAVHHFVCRPGLRVPLRQASLSDAVGVYETIELRLRVEGILWKVGSRDSRAGGSGRQSGLPTFHKM